MMNPEQSPPEDEPTIIEEEGVVNPPRNSAWGWLRLWFGFDTDVTPTQYAATGLGLMVFKYAVEASAIYAFSRRILTPVDFLNPLLSMRLEFFAPPVPAWLGWGAFFWSLVFVWIAVSMSVRRAVNAGRAPLWGMLTLVPIINYVTMFALCLLPSRPPLESRDSRDRLERLERPQSTSGLLGMFLGLAGSQLIGFGMVLLGVYVLKDYGATLFFATPVAMGATSAFVYNLGERRGPLGSIMVGMCSITVAGMLLILFAVEGAICLIMLAPLALPLGALGGCVGWMIAESASTRSTHLACLVLLPIMAGSETLYRPTPEYEVLSSVEIDAPPERVWPHVVGFSELPAPPAWYFKLGIAYPQRATITGSGVGAIRHCEFSTGAFVEPITTWDPPRRLAFDVARQPPPMHELSPFRHVHPPHLDGYLRCRRGEFRLIPLEPGRTRLEGSTWYEFEMYPQDYWTLWSDAAIGRIHDRVLSHIKLLAEGGGHRRAD